MTRDYQQLMKSQNAWTIPKFTSIGHFTIVFFIRIVQVYFDSLLVSFSISDITVNIIPSLRMVGLSGPKYSLVIEDAPPPPPHCSRWPSSNWYIHYLLFFTCQRRTQEGFIFIIYFILPLVIQHTDWMYCTCSAFMIGHHERSVILIKLLICGIAFKHNMWKIIPHTKTTIKHPLFKVWADLIKYSTSEGTIWRPI